MKQEKKLTYEQTKEKALRLLDFRSHSEAELKKKLEAAGGTEIDSVLDFCREYKLLNDEVYAKRLASDLANLKKFGRRRIKDELFARGIDSELVENAMADLEFDESIELLPLMEKKLKNNFEIFDCLVNCFAYDFA